MSVNEVAADRAGSSRREFATSATFERNGPGVMSAGRSRQMCLAGGEPDHDLALFEVAAQAAPPDRRLTRRRGKVAGQAQGAPGEALHKPGAACAPLLAAVGTVAAETECAEVESRARQTNQLRAHRALSISHTRRRANSRRCSGETA